MWAGAAATRAIGFSARRENWIEIEIAPRHRASRRKSQFSRHTASFFNAKSGNIWPPNELELGELRAEARGSVYIRQTLAVIRSSPRKAEARPNYYNLCDRTVWKHMIFLARDRCASAKDSRNRIVQYSDIRKQANQNCTCNVNVMVRPRPDYLPALLTESWSMSSLSFLRHATNR